MARDIDGKLVGDPPADGDRLALMFPSGLDGSSPWTTYLESPPGDSREFVKAYDLPIFSRAPHFPPAHPWCRETSRGKVYVIVSARDGSEFYLNETDFEISGDGERHLILTEAGERLVDKVDGTLKIFYSHQTGGRRG